MQEAWLRLSGTETAAVQNIDAWLTTVVARICLNIVRARHTRPQEQSIAAPPDPLIDPAGDIDPEHQALLADSVGLALFVVLDKLTPAERLAFVLHDVFAVPFDDIAPIIDRSVEVTRKLASRARQRIRAAGTSPDSDLAAQREVVDAFFAAARRGDFDRLVAVLHPDVVLRGDFGAAGTRSAHGANAVAKSWPGSMPAGAGRCAQLPSTGRLGRSSSRPIGWPRSWGSLSSVEGWPRSTCWPTRT